MSLLPPRSLELLAPAKDLECGRAAVDCGADAVYIGTPRFGARENAGNGLDDIAALAQHAHRYWARVYVTLNTLLRDDEIEPALRLAWQLHEIGVDGLIVQDTGLLECDLPPLPLLASTQMHIASPEKVAFLEKVGFQRAILARELDLDGVRRIRAAAPEIELEFFVHGALCVCYSGQCYLSYALGGRSGNRGECAQPCRKPYTLLDTDGNRVGDRRHYLSLRDLNLSASLGELIDAGIASFKIEGRLKDKTYVTNIVSHYRRQLDEEMERRGLRRSSSGVSSIDFSPDPAKTFHRGATAYFLHGRGEPVGSIDTPKMTGETLGRVSAVNRRGVTVETKAELHPGDGVCFFDRQGRLRGTNLNGVQGRTVVPDKPEGLEEGVLLYRNRDHRFLSLVAKSRLDRRIAVQFTLTHTAGGLRIGVVDEDGVAAESETIGRWEPAQKPESARAAVQRQLEKTGDTEYACASVVLDWEPAPFLPLSVLNEARRDALQRLTAAREAARPKGDGTLFVRSDVPYPEKELTYRGNVLNAKAEAFYRRHGVSRIEPAAESGLDLRGRLVMTTRYCIKHQLNQCPRLTRGGEGAGPLRLADEEGHILELRFDCRRCEMEVYWVK